MAQVPSGTQVPPTSLAEHNPAPDEVTVRFNRFTAVGPTAYQRGQQAGFRRSEIQGLIDRRIVEVVHDRAVIRADGPPMVKK